ncbi:MAG: Rossmann-like and DUF2520 domain-containing protein [Prolixibacteraceae bacterium]
MSQRIVFIGAGNLATRLSLELKKQGCTIVQVFSRTESSAVNLAQKLQARSTTSPDDIMPDADVYFVALKDSVIDDVLTQIDFRNRLLVHCSGSLPLSALKKYSANTGVFYPLQTFSKFREVDFKTIPVFVEACSKKNESILLQLAHQISEKVTVLDSEKRLFLHIAAVFSCNFVNHFYTIASDLLASQGISFEVVQPLIQETAIKVLYAEPQKAQTGPAIRFDENIISAHLKALDSFPEYREMYKEMSESIHKYYKFIYK